MCVISVVMDYGRMNIPPNAWTPDTFKQFKEILDKLGELDRKLDQPECHDPAKAEWMKAVEERLSTLEHNFDLFQEGGLKHVGEMVKRHKPKVPPDSEETIKKRPPDPYERFSNT